MSGIIDKNIDKDIDCDINGHIRGDITGDINGDINGVVTGNINGDINGQGVFVCPSNDYFEGEFFGSVHDRYGHLTKFSEDGCFCVGKWTNGLMEGVFDLTQTQGWKRAR